MKNSAIEVTFLVKTQNMWRNSLYLGEIKTINQAFYYLKQAITPHFTTQDANNETTMSWVEEIQILKDALSDYTGRGSLYFEYNIPRMGRRADVILVIDGIILVLEFKTSEQSFTRASEVQVWDYALDLKNFGYFQNYTQHRFQIQKPC